MHQHEFAKEMDRLSGTFGRIYGPERMKLLWQRIQFLSHIWFSKQVDTWIASLRQAPLMPEFEQALADERERQHQEAKRGNSKAASDFWEGTYHDDEIKTMCGTIRARLQGRVSDPDWKQFLDLTSRAAMH